jgi:GT2 family glycosyltransferase
VSSPTLSVVVLAWNQLPLTRACVDSLRRGTVAAYELVIVDNGSEPEAATWARDHADIAVLHATNTGFAHGMNSGLAASTAPFVAFVNNDTTFPEGWDGPLLGTFEDHPRAGIVLPAVTKAGNPASVRSEPGTERVVFEPFGHLPSGVVYLMRTEVARALGGFNPAYELATGEDVDLLFTVWANGLDVVLDTRVVVHHVSESTRRQIPDMQVRLRRNLEQFLERWKTSTPPPPRLPGCTAEELASNLRHAAAAALWLERLVEARDALRTSQSAPGPPAAPRGRFRRSPRG